MGRKDKNKKQGKGAEKTVVKTDKKFAAKQKKMLAKIGEEDIEKIVAQTSQGSDVAKNLIAVESLAPPPSPRVNFSICTHPDKEEIFFYGGEFFNGQKTEIYGDLYSYTAPKNEWKLWKSVAGPAPRSGHQMVSVQADGGQIWMFGGEFASPSQLQFYHFKDLWVFRFAGKCWEKINASNGPSARSGHRMVAAKKKLFVFGGFHDNGSSYRYFNDMHVFSMETYSWETITITGTPPPARSGCCMVANPDGKIVVWGGYSKAAVKKEFDKGVTHGDMFSFVADKNDAKGLTYKWTAVKPGGAKFQPRSGMSCVMAVNGKAYGFGGVEDTLEDEEDVQGLLSNELHLLDVNSHVWRKIELTSKKERKKEKMETTSTTDESAPTKVTSDDGVFTMVVGGASSTTKPVAGDKSNAVDLAAPSPRMNAGMVICKGNLYIFGGLFEEKHRQYTLSDFYSLDLHKLDSWKTLIANSFSQQDWLGSDSEDSGSDGDSDDDDDDSEMDDSEDDDDDSEGMDTE